MWVFDAETLRFLAVNEAAIDKYGYTRRQFLNRTITDIRPPEGVARLRALLKDRPASDISGPWKHITRDSRVIDVEVSTRSLNYSGRPAVLAVIREVTDEQRGDKALQALKASEEQGQVRALLLSASEGVLSVDKTGCIVFVNPRIEQLFGYTENELTGQPVEMLVPSAARSGHIRHRGKYMKQPNVRAMGHGRELIGRRKDGSEFPVEVSLSPVTAPGQARAMALVTDISERKVAEASLQRYAGRLRTLHSIDRAMLAGGTVKETIDDALKHIREALGCARASVTRFDEDGSAILLGAVGESNELAAPGTRYEGHEIANFRQALQDATGPLTETSKLPRKGKAGTAVRQLKGAGLRGFRAMPLKSDGKLIGALIVWYEQGAINTDDLEMLEEVADQLAVALKQADLLEEVRGHAQELEQRVEERTIELKGANDELQAFAYTVSHDLRAPLRAMQGFGQALIEDYGDTMDDMARDFTRRIVEAATHMDNLIQDLLAYSRMAQAQLDLEPVSVSEAVAAATSQLEDELRTSNAKVSAAVGEAKVNAHRQTLIQIIVNLVGNGVKFVDSAQTPEIEVVATSQGELVRIAVKDNGIGIDPRHADRIFRLFERLHGMEEYPGTGIGLAIVKKGAERMGGRVGLKSTPGEGSTFWVELPRA